jgi:type II secretory pathway component PulF
MQCLRLVGNQSRSANLQQLVSDTISGVERGALLADSLGDFRKSFGALAVSVIEIGELSGTLQQSLAYLAEELKKKQALRRKISAALIYPIFIVLATAGVGIVLTVYIFPKILPVFISLNYALPWPTRCLIFLSRSLRDYGLFLALGIFLAGAGTWYLFHTFRTARLWRDRLSLRVPIFGRLNREYHAANFARTLSILLRSQASILTALQTAAQNMSNLAYQESILQLAEQVSRGEQLSACLEREPQLYPLNLVQMAAVGESTGALPDSLAYAAAVAEEEVSELTAQLSGILEPLLMVAMGLVVGFIAISIITPIYGITQNLHN